MNWLLEFPIWSAAIVAAAAAAAFFQITSTFCVISPSYGLMLTYSFFLSEITWQIIVVSIK